MFYNNLPKEKVLEIHAFAIDKRKKENLGQRKISRLIKNKFKVDIHENTIANWIYLNKIPFGNEKTQFKPLPKPKKEKLYRLYILNKQSAQRIAKRYKVSTIIVIHWLRNYNIYTRTHKESMNTLLIKDELKNQKLKRPTKDFSKLSPEKAYILGVLCGDAWINKTSIKLEIRKDEDFIAKFSDCFNKIYGFKYDYHYYPKRNSYVLSVSSQIICTDLLKFGNFGTFVWRVPIDILETDNILLKSNFLTGFYDSEGSVAKYCITVSSANRLGLEGVSSLLINLGINNKVKKTKRGYYLITITGRERIKTFKEKIGFTIKRKMDKIYIQNDTS